MHPLVFAEFDAICRQHLEGGAVLEVGATDRGDSLLNLPAVAGVRERVGINIAGPLHGRGYTVIQGNANDMNCFSDGRFDAVLCNATLEHDPFFWKSVAEMRRVVRPGGLIALGVPGYANLFGETVLKKLGAFFDLLPLRRGWFGLRAATVTLQVHDFPGDYYRFSAQAMRDVLLAGLEGVEVRRIMAPPRLIGWGRRPVR